MACRIVYQTHSYCLREQSGVPRTRSAYESITIDRLETEQLLFLHIFHEIGYWEFNFWARMDPKFPWYRDTIISHCELVRLPQTRT